MKKIYTILVCMCMLAGLVACEKDKEFVLTTLTVTNETVTPSYETAEVSCSFKADATISEAYVQYSLSSGFAKYDVAKMTEEKGKYVAMLTDLVDNTTYYIRYAVSNKYSSVVTEEVVECQTLQCTVPTIVLDSIGEVRESHAKAYLHLNFDGGASVTDMGICWSKQANPTTKDIHISTEDTLAVLDITDLQENTKYYVRAYAVNKVGTAYSEELVFTTESVLSEPTGTENGYGYVDLGLSVKWATMNVGANNPEEYGDYFAWGETEPKDSYYWTTYKYSNGSETTLTKYNTSTMAGTVDNKTTLELSDDAAYINWDGNWRMPSEAEWEELRKQCTWTWTTKNGVKGHKVTSKINDNNIFLPASGRHFVDALTGVGVDGNYWSNTLNVASPCEAMYVLFISNGAGSFGSDRYVGHSVRPVLGEKVVELTPPIVATTVATQITATTAVTGGNVTNDGGAEVTERGVCIATISNPTTANTKILAGSGTGEFTCNLTGLQANTTYYVRAYAINSKGTAYGEEVTFTTNKQIVLPSVTTAAITQITETSAVAGGNVTSDGGASVTERGVVYATTQNPTITNTKVTSGTGTGSFTCNLTGLQPNTTYYVRAYAINSKGTAYGEEITFTTNKQVVLPSVITAAVTQITETSAVTGGNVTSDGGASVTERGVVYATTQNPTINNTKITSGIGTGSFTCNLTDLQPNTKYYVRAYAVNSQGTAYGEEMTFATEEEVIAIPEYVDLGLSVKWATFNVGAHKPEEYGDYFAWGEVEPKSEYSWSTYKWCNGYETALIKYNTDEWYGAVDNKIIIESEDDAATKNWGNDWRLPNKYEIDELRDKCTWSWINRNGTYGYQVTGPNGKSIFLPATRYMDGIEQSGVTAYGSYWSSSLYGPSTAWHLGFYSDYGDTYAAKRYLGRTIRPVYGLRMDVPKVTTTNISQITATTVLVEGNVIADGGATLVECGACIATNYNPTISDTRFITSSSIGVFACNVVGLLPNTTYYVRAYATNNVGTAYGEVVSFTTDEYEVDGTENGYAYVDLGLPSGTKWATMNVGATKIEDYGDHFAWGETEAKEYYEWSTYKWCDGTYNSLTKYNVYSSYGIVDDKTQLELLDDAANVNWGDNWRLPTDEEWTELREQCVWKWRTWNGKKGYIVTGNNNKSIFLPAAGYKDGYDYWDQSYYWSCSLDNLNVFDALSVHISVDYVQRIAENRNYGFTVRPVLGETIAEITIPTIATSVVTQITETSAVAGGNVTSDGGASVTERGVVYSTNPNPVITNLNNTIRPCGSGTGEFTYTITGLQPSTTYYIRAYAKNDAGTAYGKEVSFTTEEQLSTPNNGTENGYAYVDLGLSVKWATMNVGASSPEGYGDYFAWGEVKPKNEYSWSNYKYCYSYYNNLTKYNTYSSYGTVDNITTLELGDDVARANWGSSWRMPNEAELSELREQCTWTWTTQNGVNGYKVTSKSNGNSIFLPAAGYRTDSKLNAVGSDGCYWANSISSTLPYCAWRLNFNTSEVKWNGDNRYYGQSVRPVYP